MWYAEYVWPLWKGHSTPKGSQPTGCRSRQQHKEQANFEVGGKKKDRVWLWRNHAYNSLNVTNSSHILLV